MMHSVHIALDIPINPVVHVFLGRTDMPQHRASQTKDYCGSIYVSGYHSLEIPNLSQFS